MARVLIIGGHGKIALLAAPRLVAAGHEVTSMFRNPEHEAEVAATGATPLVGDVENMDEHALATAMTGQDVVLWSAGAGGGDPQRTFAVDRDAAIRSMDAAERAGVQRYVMVSYLGARLDHGVPEDDSFFPYAESKAVADAHLRAGSRSWTILMPGMLTTEDSGGVTLNPGPDAGTDTSRALVADVITAVVQASERAVAGVEIPFVDGEQPIEEALASLASD